MNGRRIVGPENLARFSGACFCTGVSAVGSALVSFSASAPLYEMAHGRAGGGGVACALASPGCSVARAGYFAAPKWGYTAPCQDALMWVFPPGVATPPLEAFADWMGVTKDTWDLPEFRALPHSRLLTR